ncbi:GDSL esterase/lipase At1g29670-like [Vicia villosa]|uniref:GDSL esterase/lipase At1g29670-like n=1 Tax=Vicia villosa TaxID=3911 RepID=UPI00273CAD59|nr:GDSL esterase/lipase At1g29670-like [Vicia villosa]
MDSEIKLWLVILILFSSAIYSVVGVPQVPCLFIFGDSLSDNGNNNDLVTDAKVNYKPYGIDFPSGPTGRFTNGRTSVDIIGDLLGFDHYIPPYANSNGTYIVEGVNYASGAAGIRNETGTHLGTDISMGLQLEHHKDIVSQIATKLGSTDKVQQHLNKCLYYVNIGSNDYLNNYFLPQHYPTNGKYNINQYAVALIQEHASYLKALYELGARKFSLIGLSLIGCIPHVKKGSLCSEEHNKAALLFNNKLKSLVDRFNKEFSDAKFIFINTAIMTYNSLKQDMKTLTCCKMGSSGECISNEESCQDKNFHPFFDEFLPSEVVNIPTANMAYKGMEISKCCKVGSNGQCIPNEEPCKFRNLHPFFDEFHPTEVVNKVVANMAYKAPVPACAHPMDISHLVKL